MSQNHKELLYRAKSAVKVGELNRFVVSYTPSKDQRYSEGSQCLWLRVKNLEALPLRAAYLAGPYILYVDVKPGDYDQSKKLFATAEQPVYESQVKAGQVFYAQLYMHKFQDTYKWTVDVVSQILFSTKTEVQFELLIGHSKDCLHQHSTVFDQSGVNTALKVQKLDTLDIWHSPTPRADEPVHLVVITHGLHSNTGTDMLFLKEKIDEAAKVTGENIIVRGYHGNACRTEKGIKYLGRRVGDYVLDELVPEEVKEGDPRITKISFIGHSLGGLVQTFAIAHINHRRPDFFKTVAPVNFITLATPHLGISNENPGYIKFALDVGFAGKTGQDLGLTWKPSTKKKNRKPLLQVLPTGPTHEILKKFNYRTLYANSVNDGIVPLRTAAILYLDWRALSKAARVQRGEAPDGELGPDSPARESKANGALAHSSGEMGEIPEEVNDSEPKSKTSFLKSFTKQSGEIVDSITGPFNSLLSFLAPQAGGKKPGKIYQRSQTLNGDNEDDEGFIKVPKRTTLVESGVSVLLPPLPSQNFIVDPASRPDVIFHDRLYTEKDLPSRRFTRKSSLFSPITPRSGKSFASNSSVSSADSEGKPFGDDVNMESNIVEKAKIEERIAREWHREMTWRKVLVRLEPDAHNNIVVRRRFANAYGWPVIDHLVENHFRTTDSHPDPIPACSSTAPSSITPYTPASMNPAKNKRPMRPVDIIRSPGMRTNLPTCIPERIESPVEQDMSNLSLDTSFPYQNEDEDSRPKSRRSTSSASMRSLQRTNTGDSILRAWESHLQIDEDDSEDEGIVHGMGAWIDSMRDIGTLNVSAFVDTSAAKEVNEETKELAEAMESAYH